MSEDFLERALEMCREFKYCGVLVAQAVQMLKGMLVLFHATHCAV